MHVSACIAEGRTFTHDDDLYDAIIVEAVERVGPKTMTVAAIVVGLLAIMWSHGAGAEVHTAHRRIDD